MFAVSCSSKYDIATYHFKVSKYLNVMNLNELLSLYAGDTIKDNSLQRHDAENFHKISAKSVMATSGDYSWNFVVR